MVEPVLSPPLSPDVCHRAVDDRDPRFDGLFFVAIITTRIYCRPICPSRRANPGNRRFFGSVAEAESAGYRACRRCHPKLAVGHEPFASLARLAQAAANRICRGELNGRGVAELAGDLGVSERHLRRALRRELGVSPVELAQTHRLQLARRLLADTALPVIDIAFASGFESLRRFNAAFRERYGTSPGQARKTQGAASSEDARRAAPKGDLHA